MAQSSLPGSAPGSSFLWQFSASVPPGDHFSGDGLYVLDAGGRAKLGRWPAAQPGPDDAWAGSRAHTYSIVFGLKGSPGGSSGAAVGAGGSSGAAVSAGGPSGAAVGAGGLARLSIHLMDVGPDDVSLLLSVNGHAFHKRIPEGASEAIYGDKSKGKPYNFDLDIPADNLVDGDNHIDLTTENGSWLIYDWIGLSVPSGLNLSPVKSSVLLAGALGLPFLKGNMQPVRLSFINTGDSILATLKMAGLPDQPVGIGSANRAATVMVPAVLADSTITIRLERKGRLLASTKVLVHPVRKMTIYILPHSHNDIGYTEIQTNVERKQMNNLLTGIEYARQTKDYPEGARFVWNLEGMYAADLFMHRMSADQQQSFIQAVKSGSVGLNGMYVNTLTGLCRPEELLQLFHYSNELAATCGTTMQSAMISDVPGYTWGTVTAMAQAGIRYFSAAPNYFDRIGDILVQWEDKPFWWVSPSGKEKVLVWIPYKGYALSHGMPQGLSAAFVDSYLGHLQQKGYPYDITYIRWSGHGDNAVPDRSICDFVKDWNAEYTWPKFVISTTTMAFKAFEDRYGAQLPEEKGDWTGYWEDGAGSSALETAENRSTSSRLTQAEALWAMTNPGAFPADGFHQAWKNVILYSEHTWGADESVTRPLSQKTAEQWFIKKSYATLADSLSHQLLASALWSAPGTRVATAASGAFDVYNTSSWPRTELVILSASQSQAGDMVKDASGKSVPAQRLSTGELAFVAEAVPPFGSSRYSVSAGGAATASGPGMSADTRSLDNGLVHLELDTVSGAVRSLRLKGIDNEFVDNAEGEALNDYLFLPGNKLSDLQHIHGVKISVKENGPVLMTLRISSEAPGCASLIREVRLVKGFDYAEVFNYLDKSPAELDPYPGSYPWANLHGKESLHIAFPFHVPEGQMKLDIPMAQIEPQTQQIPGSCRNWLEVGGWADVSNKDLGITWITLDAPLVEVGAITATLLGGQSNPAVWRKSIEPSQKLYSWALNNHWETNYRAYQEGHIQFRYVLQPHKAFDAAASTRLATAFAQPLIVAPAIAEGRTRSLLTLDNTAVVVESLRPSIDGKAWMVTLYNPGLISASVTPQWSMSVGASSISNTSEVAMGAVNGPVTVAAQDVVTLRVERK
jgi:alpha-mannosidase